MAKKINLLNSNIYTALFMSLLPLTLCIIRAALTGHTIFDVYIPAGEWNDELFYFKQVEGMIEYGFPYGFFGFNESHAKILSFAAWSPVLVIPWIIWGLIFGWNLMSPIYANIFYMSLAIFIFVLIVKPNKKQLLRLTILFSLFTPLTRYMMSAMPEAICFALLIIFLACAIDYMRSDNIKAMISMFVIASLLTLMRPYFIVFLLLPILYVILMKKWKGVFISGLITMVVGGVYALIKVFLGAEYFTDLYDVSWVKRFFTHGIFGGIKYTVGKLYNVGWDFFGKCYQALTNGLASGAYFIGFLTIFIIIVVYAIYQIKKKAYKEGIVYGHLAFSCFAMWIALLLMYKMTEGSKHLIAFIVIGIFALAMMEVKFQLQVVVSGLIFIYLYIIMAIDPYDYAVTYKNDKLLQDMQKAALDFEEKLILDLEETPNYNNTVIWVFADNVEEEQVITDWQLLYGLPKGFGISCSYNEFILENFEELQSKYILIPKGSEIEKICIDKDLKEITSGLDSVMYQLR